MPIRRRASGPRGVLAFAILPTSLAACGDPGPPAAPPATSLTVPHFSTDDPRVGTAGFVSQTTRTERGMGGTTYTLMIFAVGDRVTLGAMVNGPFEGTATWSVGDRTFRVPLSRANRGRGDVPVTGQPLTGQHGGFDAFDWVNVEVPLDEWLKDGTLVRLAFRGGGVSVALPSEDEWFVSVLAER